MILKVVRIMGSQVTGGDWRSKRALRKHTSKPLFLGGSHDSVLRVVCIMVTKLALGTYYTYNMEFSMEVRWLLVVIFF